MLALDRLKRASLQRIRKAGGNNTRLGTEKAQPGQRHDAATARTASMPACRDCEPAANVFLLSPRERERERVCDGQKVRHGLLVLVPPTRLDIAAAFACAGRETTRRRALRRRQAAGIKASLSNATVSGEQATHSALLRESIE